MNDEEVIRALMLGEHPPVDPVTLRREYERFIAEYEKQIPQALAAEAELGGAADDLDTHAGGTR